MNLNNYRHYDIGVGGVLVHEVLQLHYQCFSYDYALILVIDMPPVAI